jgi:O-succinylbenzoic acid--CoA ligase
LGSSFGLHTYEDLRQFQRFFLQYLFDFDHDFDKAVGFLAESSDTLVFAIAACWNLGIPFVTYNPKAPVEDLKKQISEFEPGLIFTEKRFLPLLEYDMAIEIKELDLPRSLTMDVELGYAAKTYKPDTSPDQIFGYFYTSGTSGTPKIVPLKRRQMLFAAQASAENFRPRANHFWLLCMPLNHIGGISLILRSILYGSAIFRMKSFHTKMIITFLSENKLFQAASFVPTMLKRLMDKPGFSVHNNFKAILLGGGPIYAELVQQANTRGIPLVPSYGMTETCAQIAANPILKPSGTYAPMKSVGQLFSPNEIEIRDEKNRPLGINNSGEIWLKGPQVFDGYLNENKSDGIDKEGWFKTGDYGHLNANNQLFIESRRSDLIITGGENVSPFEIESELEKIPPITEAAVIGLPDEEWGQKVVAVVVAKTQQSINSDKIQTELKKYLTGYKIPKKIIQTDSLPRTHTGKIIRSELVKLFEK